MAFCVKCGKLLADDAAFCTVCGTPVNPVPAANPYAAPANPVPAHPAADPAPVNPVPMQPAAVDPAPVGAVAEAVTTPVTPAAPMPDSAPVYEAPVMPESAPMYATPVMPDSAPVYAAPVIPDSAPVYAAPAPDSAPVYAAPTMPAQNYAPVYPNPVNPAPMGTPQGALPIMSAPNIVPAGERKKSKAPIIALIAVLGLAVLGIVLFFVFRKSETEKIAEAFQNTLFAESFTVDGRLRYRRDDIKFSGEIIGSKKYKQFYFVMKDGEYTDCFSYVNERVLEKYSYEDYYYGDEIRFREDNINEDDIEILDMICMRDWRGFLDKLDEEEDLDKYCKNLDEAPEILYRLLEDCVKNKDDAGFLKDASKKGNEYTFVINVVKLVRALKKDYGLKVDSDLYDDIMDELDRYEIGDVEVTFEIEDKYVTRISVEFEYDGNTMEGYVEFSGFNELDGKKSRAAKLERDADEYFEDRRRYDW